MPLYRFTAPVGSATLERRADVATAVTTVHADVTGAPAAYVQCSFTAVERDSIFVAGEARDIAQMVGSIRVGRSEATRRALLHGIADAWSGVTGEPRENITIYLHEAPGSQMLENGETLPEADQDPGAIG